jgi:SHAQKYF class myb-like DNA-binding protein
MVESYSPFVIFEEKNPRKFSIEIEHPNYIGLTHPKFEVDKGINFSEEEKPSNIFMPNKTSTFNSTNIFLISNIKENNKNETKFSQFSQNVSENNNNYQNIFEEKQKINTSKENENSDSNNNEYHSGRWTNEEHDKFIEGILKYGNEWKRVQSIIKTRSSTQARSHAQKFFLRMKKEINPKNFSNLETLLQYIINSTTNKTKSYTPLTNEQKDRLFSVIRSNLKPEENQNKNNDSQYANKKDSELGLDYINEEEDDNLAYNKANNVLNKKMSISDIGEKRKVTFCSKKRKNNSDYILSVNDNKIFSIKKDMNHKRSMDITKSSDNFINNLGKKSQDIKKTLNELNNNNSINNINNINNNNIYINNNKSANFNNLNNTNFIIQNNYYNIINNYNNFNNQGNLNFNVNNNNNNNPINVLQNNILNNTYLNNDSINSDINNHNNKFFSKEKIIKNNLPEISEYEKNNINIKNPFENYTFLNNENFFPNLNKNIQFDNYNKNYDNTEQNDPFNLKFENVSMHNDHNDNNNDNNTIINDNLYLNHNIEDGQDAHDIDDYEFDRMNFGRNNNNITDKPYDD